MIGRTIGISSLLLALLAFLPSIAPFTAALLGSVIAFFGAWIGAFSGGLRVSVLTLYTVLATFLVSPICSGVERYIELGHLVIILISLGVIFAIYLLLNYRKSIRSA